MDGERNKLYITASDLWYTLREDYKSADAMLTDFYNYLRLEAKLAKGLSKDERESLGIYKDEPISHEDRTGRNIAYSILTTIAICSEWFPKNDNATLNQALWITLHIFDSPDVVEYWDEFYKFVDSIDQNKE